ncbi:MAG: hypothetical protein NTZ05_00965 [Chloroflexi bacterium]|nr:hypothetical protein [Chloroflexota bacterium]
MQIDTQRPHEAMVPDRDIADQIRFERMAHCSIERMVSSRTLDIASL